MLLRIRIGQVIALVIVGGTLSSGPTPTVSQTLTVTGSDAGPRFRADGPQADLFGRNEQYPSCTGLAYMRAGAAVSAPSAISTLSSLHGS